MRGIAIFLYRMRSPGQASSVDGMPVASKIAGVVALCLYNQPWEAFVSNFSGAYYVVSGVPFAVALVTPQAVSSQKAISDAIDYFARFFPQVPIVLARQMPDGRTKFWGRDDLISYLVKDPNPVPWRDYTTG